MATASQLYRRQMVEQAHGMARTKVCRSKTCHVCTHLPIDNPPEPTAETNILIRMRDERIREQREREMAPAPIKPVVAAAMPVRATVERPVCKVPPVEGIAWAAVGNLISHAYQPSGNSMCGKWTREKANFERTAYNYCRNCQVAVLKMQGFHAYLISDRVCVRTAEGSRRI